MASTLIRYCVIAVVLITGGFQAACGQARSRDTINCSSTCVGTAVELGSPVFDSLPFPDLVHWDFGDPASGIYNTSGAMRPRHVFNSAGTYYISLMVVNGGDTLRLRDTVKIIYPIAGGFGPDIYLCEGGDALLKAPFIPGASYTWNDNLPTHTDTLRVKQSGVYTVSINGCGVTDSIGVFISNKPLLNLGKDHVMCDSANLLLDVSSQNAVYRWLLNGDTLGFRRGQLLTHYPGGKYVAVVTVPGCGTYKDSVSVTYASPLAPAFEMGPDTLLCPKQVYTLDATMAGAKAYDWSTGAVTPQITVTQPGAYWVFVTGSGGCQVTDTVQVRYRGDKNLNFHDTAICKGSTLVLNADFGVGKYDWEAIPPQRDDQNQTGQATYFVYRPGKYAVTATVGQCIYKDTLTVSFDDSLRVKMPGDTTLCNGEDFLLTVVGNGDQYAWQDSSHGSLYRVDQPGIYRVVASNGCGKDTLTSNIKMVPCNCRLLLPNAFTPDGNGHNETFRPLHVCEMTEFRMQIYDRYGNLVFRSADPGLGWDGTFGGSRVPSGTFVWMVQYKSTTTGQIVNKKGTVLVIR